MASLNKVQFIGRLTREPEVVNFKNGGKVAKFSFAVNDRTKNSATGEWEDEPMFIDVSAFNTQYSQMADRVEKAKKGSQLYIEGNLKLEKWTDAKTSQQRSKHTVRLANFQFLDPKNSDDAPKDNSDVNREIGGDDDPKDLYPSKGKKVQEEIPF